MLEFFWGWGVAFSLFLFYWWVARRMGNKILDLESETLAYATMVFLIPVINIFFFGFFALAAGFTIIKEWYGS